MDPISLAVRNRPKPRAKPKPKAPTRSTTKTIAKKTPPPTLAQRQLSEAEQIAAAAIDPQISSVNEAVLAAETARVNRMHAAEGVTNALAALSSGDADAARAAYAEAAQRIGQYGQGLTGTLRGLQEASGAAMGVPTDAASNANVAQMLGAVIPGETLASSAPRALEQSQAHRLAAGMRLADDASASDYRSGQEIAGIRAKIQELESKRPGLIMEALDDLKQRANAERATNVQIGYLQLQQAKTIEDRAVAMTNLTGSLHVVVGRGTKAHVVDTHRPALGSDAAESATRAETSRLNAAASAETARQATAQRARTAAAAEAGRNARAEASRKATIEAAKIKTQNAQNKPATPAQKNTILNGANATGTNIVNAIADRIWAGIPGTQAKGKDEKQADYEKRIAAATVAYKNRLANNRGTLMAQVINSIAPNLRLIGYTQEQIRQVAARLVSAVTPAQKKPAPVSGR